MTGEVKWELAGPTGTTLCVQGGFKEAKEFAAIQNRIDAQHVDKTRPDFMGWIVREAGSRKRHKCWRLKYSTKDCEVVSNFRSWSQAVDAWKKYKTEYDWNAKLVRVVWKNGDKKPWP